MRHRVPFLILTVGLFAGCSPTCGAWEDVEVSEGLGTTEQRDAIEDALATFAEWTGREETCVSEVALVDAVTSTEAGRYDPVFRRITVAEQSSVLVKGAVIHQLCHALDHEAGWPSHDAAGILNGDAVDAGVYPTEDARLSEAFARICEAGPVLPAVWAQLEETCGADVATDDVAFVHEVAYSESDYAEDFTTFGYDFDTVDIGDLRAAGPGGVEVAVGGDHRLMLDHGFVEEGVDLFVEPLLFLLDPDSSAPIETLALDRNVPARDDNGQPVITTRMLVSSTADALVYQFVGEPLAWRVHTEPLRLEEVTLPELPDGTFLLFEDAGVLWARVPGDTGAFLARIDLTTGLVAPLVPTESVAADELGDVFVDERGALATYTSNDGLLVVELNTDGTPTAVQRIPIDGARSRSVVRLPDDTVLVTLSMDTSGDVSVPLPVRLDLATGAWSVPDGECESLNRPWNRVGDEVWYAYQDTDAEGYQVVAAKLTVDP